MVVLRSTFVRDTSNRLCQRIKTCKKPLILHCGSFLQPLDSQKQFVNPVHLPSYRKNHEVDYFLLSLCRLFSTTTITSGRNVREEADWDPFQISPDIGKLARATTTNQQEKKVILVTNNEVQLSSLINARNNIPHQMREQISFSGAATGCPLETSLELATKLSLKPPIICLECGPSLWKNLYENESFRKSDDYEVALVGTLFHLETKLNFENDLFSIPSPLNLKEMVGSLALKRECSERFPSSNTSNDEVEAFLYMQE